MSLVVANAISISVRERRTEMAVLKVLGFQPRHVMLLVLGEALLVGFLAGGDEQLPVRGRCSAASSSRSCSSARSSCRGWRCSTARCSAWRCRSRAASARR